MMYRKNIVRGIVFLALSLVAWCILANVYRLASWRELLVLFFLCLLFILVPNQTLRDFAAKLKKFFVRYYKPFLWGLIVISIIGRVLFVGIFSYNPYSDPGTFFTAASNLSTNGTLLDSRYIADFPYTYAYDALLALSMKFFGAGIASVVTLNMVLDAISAFILYKLATRLIRSKESPLPLLLAATWITNPFTVLFSLLSLPVALFNTFVILSIFLSFHLLNNLKNIKIVIILSILTGLVLGLANTVRPLAAVFLIALLGCFIIYIFTQKKWSHLVSVSISSIIITGCFLLISPLYTSLVSNKTSYTPAHSAGGWSFYVGTNLKTSGQWSIDDLMHRQEVEKTTASSQAMHDAMLQKALDRFNSYSYAEKVELFTKKAIVLGGEQGRSTYNMQSYPGIKNHPEILNLLYVWCALFTWTVLILSFVYLYTIYKSKNKEVDIFIVYLSLTLLGLFGAQLLTEVSPRYFEPFFVFLMIFATLSIHEVAFRPKTTTSNSKR